MTISLPLTRPAVGGADAASLCTYFSLYHEAVVANLLERLLLCGGGVEAASEDALFELADYSVRSVRERAAARARAPASSLCAHTRAARAGVAIDARRLQGGRAARAVRSAADRAHLRAGTRHSALRALLSAHSATRAGRRPSCYVRRPARS
jgi:hypothetical protein